jgi:ribosomal protein S18 acetylase RimI-like enzyme
MASILVLTQKDLHKLGALEPHQRRCALDQIQRIERQVFPKHEAMQFDSELKKRNAVLTIVVGGASDVSERPLAVLAYMLHYRSRGTAALQKLCVAQSARRQGISRRLLQQLKSNLRAQGCDNVELWVDEERLPARSLYTSLGFEITSRLPNYYAAGRHALRMKASME